MSLLEKYWDPLPKQDFRIALAITLVPLAIMLFLSVANPPDTINKTSFLGCYTAEDAPTLNVLDDRIAILDSTGRSFEYELDINNAGHIITVSPALRLQGEGPSYEFIEVRGVGFFWQLLDGDPTSATQLSDPENYSGQFRILADSGQSVVYTRQASATACQNGAPLTDD